jgi:hypothetical protein
VADKRLSAKLDELRADYELLRAAQDKLVNISLLGVALRPSGLEVLSYDGPARYELGRVVRCELCGEIVDVSDRAHELRLLSRTWGPRYGYVHKECFERATRLE